jgi:hypothetical protein
MTKGREEAMMIAAKILNGPFDKISQEDLETILDFGNVVGGFICGVRWADKNPESPWHHVGQIMPEECCPKLGGDRKHRYTIKVFVRMMDGRMMETTRRLSIDGTWYWNMDMRMREQITHWMAVPPINWNLPEG